MSNTVHKSGKVDTVGPDAVVTGSCKKQDSTPAFYDTQTTLGKRAAAGPEHDLLSQKRPRQDAGNRLGAAEPSVLFETKFALGKRTTAETELERSSSTTGSDSPHKRCRVATTQETTISSGNKLYTTKSSLGKRGAPTCDSPANEGESPPVFKKIRRQSWKDTVQPQAPKPDSAAEPPCVSLPSPSSTVDELEDVLEPPGVKRPPASFTTIEPEVRFEVLRHLLLLERNQHVEYRSATLSTTSYRNLARDPWRYKSDHRPGQWWANVNTDRFHQTGLSREIHYRPSLAILGVCKKIRAEAEDILYHENQWIGIHNAPDNLINKLRKVGISLRRWRGRCDDLMEPPVVQIDFLRGRPPQGGTFRADRWLLFPPSDLPRLGVVMSNKDLYTAPSLDPDQRVMFRLLPCNRLMRAFHCKNIDDVRGVVDAQLVKWIGTEVQGDLSEGLITYSLDDRQKSLGPPAILVRTQAEQNMAQIRILKDAFDHAYDTHVYGEGIEVALSLYLDIREKIWHIARSCPSLKDASNVTRTTPEWHLLAMLSWILYQLAALPANKSPVNNHWQVLFASRVLTLPTYVPDTEWKARTHMLVASLMPTDQGIRVVKTHHLFRAGVLLNLPLHHPMTVQLTSLNQAGADRVLACVANAAESIDWAVSELTNEVNQRYPGDARIENVALETELLRALKVAEPL